ncbi:MAG: hypothetical protein Q8M17_10335, partial [Actinomycetota bacterium]|nr:hypothetical protein [Actinomycetota bacterium]
MNGIPGSYDYPDFTMIGGVTVDGVEFQTEGFHGSIADVSVWNTALTQQQVQAAQFTSLTGNESGLVAYFPLNDGSGTTAADLTNGEGGLTLLGDPGWTANSGDNWLADGVTINEDTPLRLTSLSVSDPDAASAPISVTLSVQHGTLAFDDADMPGLTGDLDGSDGTVSLTGSQSAINAALANGVVYIPESNYSGPSQLTVTVNDQGHNGPGGAQSAEVHFDINVAPVNDAPVFTGDDLAASYTGNPVAIATSVLASDVDSDSYSGGSLTATVTDGGHEGDTLSIANTQYISLDGTNVMFDSDGSGDAQQPVLLGVLTSNYNTLTVSLNNNAGDAAVAALTQAIQFGNAKPDPEAGTRTVTFTLNDGGGAANGGHDTDYFNATVEVTA